jgi:hypothetical protein
LRGNTTRLYRSLPCAVACGALIPLSGGCGADPWSAHPTPVDIAVISLTPGIVNREALAQAARLFYAEYPDDFDMIVLWSAPEFAPGYSFYLPVQNDVPGIGQAHFGREFFNDSAEFGSTRLQGIIWMSPDWRTKDASAEDPASALGTLAHETAHRWAAAPYFAEDNGHLSDGLLAGTAHWGFFLDTGSSPLGGNRWEHVKGSLYRATPVRTTLFCDLDLYLMGLITADDVPPIMLLTRPRTETGEPDTRFRVDSGRVTEVITIAADAESVTISQIVAAEGLRRADEGFAAAEIRQAWVYVVSEAASPPDSDLEKLEAMQARWSRFFDTATRGLGSVTTVLQPGRAARDKRFHATELR